MEYEIDIARYARAIVRRWRLILGIALLGALLAGGWAFSQPRKYTADASVVMLIRQTGSQLGAGEDLLSIETIDVGARRIGLYTVATSDAIESRLPAEVVERIAVPNYRPGMLVADQWVGAELQGDVLIVRASGLSPEQAKMLADAWAHTFVDYVQPLFPDEHSEVNFASEAVLPFKPVGRGLVRNAALAGVAGALIGVGLALALEWSRRTSDPVRRAEGERVLGEPSPSR